MFTSDCRGILEDSEIYNTEDLLVRITHGADPIIRNCRIHTGTGIETGVRAKGLIENCEIFNISSAAIDFGESTTTVCKCRIHDAGRGIVDFEKTNTVEDCEIFRIKKYVPGLDIRPLDFKD